MPACPECGSAMTQGRGFWVCLECGARADEAPEPQETPTATQETAVVWELPTPAVCLHLGDTRCHVACAAPGETVRRLTPTPEVGAWPLVYSRETGLPVLDASGEPGGTLERVVSALGTGVTYEVGDEGESVLPQELLAASIRLIMEAATQHLRAVPEHVVLCVPGHFFAGQRAAARDAARIAGVDDVLIVNSLSAAVGAWVGAGERAADSERPALIAFEYREEAVLFGVALPEDGPALGRHRMAQMEYALYEEEEAGIERLQSFCLSLFGSLEATAPRALLFAPWDEPFGEEELTAALGGLPALVSRVTVLSPDQVAVGFLAASRAPGEISAHNLWVAGRERDLRLLQGTDPLPAHVEFELHDPAAPEEPRPQFAVVESKMTHMALFQDAVAEAAEIRICETMRLSVAEWRRATPPEEPEAPLVFRRKIRRVAPFPTPTAFLLHQGRHAGNYRPLGPPEEGAAEPLMLWADEVYNSQNLGEAEDKAILGAARRGPWHVKPWSRFFQTARAEANWQERMVEHAEAEARQGVAGRFERERNTLVAYPALLEETEELIDLGEAALGEAQVFLLSQQAIKYERHARVGGLHVVVSMDEGGEIALRAAQRYLECEIEVEWQFRPDAPLADSAIRDLHGRLLSRLMRHREAPTPGGSDGSVHDLYRRFEVSLRDLVAERLQACYGEDWWRQGVPKDVRVKVAVRREESGDDLPPLNHTDLGDLLQILTVRENREAAFRAVVPYDEFPNRVRGLIPVRNAIAHFKKSLDDYEVSLIRGAQEMLDQALGPRRSE